MSEVHKGALLRDKELPSNFRVTRLSVFMTLLNDQNVEGTRWCKMRVKMSVEAKETVQVISAGWVSTTGLSYKVTFLGFSTSTE